MAAQHSELHDLLAQGRFAQLEARCAELVRRDPCDAVAWQFYGASAYQQGEFPAAVERFERAAASAPHDPFQLNNLGLALQAVGRLTDAARVLRQAVALGPTSAVLMANLANVLNQLEHYAAAEALCRAALQTDPQHVDAYIGLGAALAYQGLSVQSEACFERAAELAPDNLEVRRNLAHLYQETGRFDAAAQAYESCLAHDPTDGDAWQGLASTRRYSSADEPIVARLRTSLATPRLPASAESDMHYAFGKILDDRGEYDAAFAHFTAAKKAPQETYDRDDFHRRVDLWITSYPRQRWEQPCPGANESELPVFIVGLPRSGSTLVEQILGAHHAVYAGGELGDLKSIMTGQTPAPATLTVDPQSLAQIPPETLQTWSQWYLSRRRIVAADALRVTDKMPVNFMFLGLIAQLFPNARVIHCRRQPLDCCLSIYAQRFVVKPEYANSLDNLGHFYHEYQRLMQHWQQTLPLRMIDVQYEELTTQPEPVIRELVEFLGLPWDGRCLRFHEQRSAVQTASSWQVRQPLHRGSIGRWKNYAAHLQPLIDVLGTSATNEPVIRQWVHSST